MATIIKQIRTNLKHALSSAVWSIFFSISSFSSSPSRSSSTSSFSTSYSSPSRFPILTPFLGRICLGKKKRVIPKIKMRIAPMIIPPHQAPTQAKSPSETPVRINGCLILNQFDLSTYFFKTGPKLNARRLLSTLGWTIEWVFVERNEQRPTKKADGRA